MCDYRSEAESDARATIDEFKDVIFRQLLNHGKASVDLYNDYPNGDAWHHESHIDKCYSLTEAAELINELSEYEETDSGLWESQQLKDAMSTCAAYTYGGAVYDMWIDLIKEINREAEIFLDDFSDRIDAANEAEEDEDYDGPNSNDLRRERKEALEELIDRIATG